MSGPIKNGIANAGKLAGGKVLKKGAWKAVSKVNPTKVFQELVKAYRDWRKVADQEQTKREKIEAWRKTQLAEIEAKREILMTYLQESFDERRENFNRFFEVLDKAVDSHDIHTVDSTLGAIVRLAESSPFKDLASVASVRATLEDPEKDFEI